MKPIKRIDGSSPGPSAPETVVRPCNPRRFISFCHEDPKLCVTDFGEAFFAADRKPNRELHTALSVAAPEILLEDWDEVGSHSDVWALACTIFEILADHRLFEAAFDEPEEVLLEIVSALNGADNFPEKWNSKFPESEQPNRDLKDRVAGLIRSEDAEDRFQEGELQALTVVLEKMLKYNPRERIPAAEVVERLPEEWKPT
jgi:serine/threonine-protein kinase SRPK3